MPAAAIASEYDVTRDQHAESRVERRANLGAERASGEIVAYIDDDAQPDPALAALSGLDLRTTDHAVWAVRISLRRATGRWRFVWPMRPAVPCMCC